MKRRQIVAFAVAVVLCVIAIVAYRTTQQFASLESVLARLPSGDAAVLSIDFAALRQGGILNLLSGPVVDEEPEYKTFVEKTAFDYRRDLDHAFVAFHPGGVYYLVRGRFDWKRLEAYVHEQGGECSNGLCRMAGSLPSRKISYFQLRKNLLAMAVSTDASAAAVMQKPPTRPRPVAFLKQPVWLSLSSSTLKRSADFPTGTQLFAKAMEDADSATLSIAPKGQALEAQLDVVCRDARDASILAAQFQKMTSVLRQLIEKENHQPTSADLAGVLLAGVFQQQDTHVVGQWPIERAFLDNLAGKP